MRRATYGRVVARGRRPCAPLLMAALLVLAPSADAPASANEAGAPAIAAEARANIDAVLASAEFGHTEKTTRLRYKKPDSDKKKRDWLTGLRGFLRSAARVFAGIGEVLLWVGATLGVLAIVYYRERWLPYLGRMRRRSAIAAPGPRVDIKIADRPLPSDIPAAALRLCRKGYHAEALGLLYRGAIARSRERFDVRLPTGATEGDVLCAIACAAPLAVDYFEALTRVWMSLAYAGREPETIGAEIEPLAAGFRRYLEGP